MWLLKTHFGEKRLCDNYMLLSSLIGDLERSLRSSFRTSDLTHGVGDISACVRCVWGV